MMVSDFISHCDTQVMPDDQVSARMPADMDEEQLLHRL